MSLKGRQDYDCWTYLALSQRAEELAEASAQGGPPEQREAGSRRRDEGGVGAGRRKKRMKLKVMMGDGFDGGGFNRINGPNCPC